MEQWYGEKAIIINVEYSWLAEGILLFPDGYIRLFDIDNNLNNRPSNSFDIMKIFEPLSCDNSLFQSLQSNNTNTHCLVWERNEQVDENNEENGLDNDENDPWEDDDWWDDDEVLY